MRIIYFSDTHNFHDQVKIPPCDLLICGGDISGVGERREVERFLKWFKRQLATYRVFIAGNHDRSFDPEKNPTGEKPEWLVEALEEFKNCGTNYYLENSSCEIEGLTIWGSPVTPSFGKEFWAFNKDRGEEINEVWKNIPDKVDIVVTHGPVHGVLDDLMNGQRVGCEDLRKRINEVSPMLHLSGHIHFGYGIHDWSSTAYLNGAICDEDYSPINNPWLITLNDNNQIDLIEKVYEI